MILQREIAAFCRNKIPCNTCWTTGGATSTPCSEHGPVVLIPFYEEVIENNSKTTHFGKFWACEKCLEKEYGPIKDAEEVRCCEVCGLSDVKVGTLNECKYCKAKVCSGCMNGGACSDCEDYGTFIC